MAAGLRLSGSPLPSHTDNSANQQLWYLLKINYFHDAISNRGPVDPSRPVWMLALACDWVLDRSTGNADGQPSADQSFS